MAMMELHHFRLFIDQCGNIVARRRRAPRAIMQIIIFPIRGIIDTSIRKLNERPKKYF
jgi:hypothetical protein